MLDRLTLILRISTLKQIKAGLLTLTDYKPKKVFSFRLTIKALLAVSTRLLLLLITQAQSRSGASGPRILLRMTLLQRITLSAQCLEIN